MRALGSFLGIIITLAALLGGFGAMGGNLVVLMQPWEFVIILGTAVGTFLVANPWNVVVDTGLAAVQAVARGVPKERYYLDLLGHIREKSRYNRTMRIVSKGGIARLMREAIGERFDI